MQLLGRQTTPNFLYNHPKSAQNNGDLRPYCYTIRQKACVLFWQQVVNHMQTCKDTAPPDKMAA